MNLPELNLKNVIIFLVILIVGGLAINYIQSLSVTYSKFCCGGVEGDAIDYEGQHHATSTSAEPWKYVCQYYEYTDSSGNTKKAVKIIEDCVIKNQFCMYKSYGEDYCSAEKHCADYCDVVGGKSGKVRLYNGRCCNWDALAELPGSPQRIYSWGQDETCLYDEEICSYKCENGICIEEPKEYWIIKDNKCIKAIAEDGYSTLAECEKYITSEIEIIEEKCKGEETIGKIDNLEVKYQSFKVGLVVRLNKKIDGTKTVWVGKYDCNTGGKKNAIQAKEIGWVDDTTYLLLVSLLKENPACDCFEEIPKPEEPTIKTFSFWISNIIDWIKNLFSKIFPLAITGPTIIEPNTLQIYSIDMQVEKPDDNWNDGSYQVQYANWALINKDEKIIKEGEWEQIYGIYNKNIQITVPSEPGNFVILGMITQYDLTYDFNKKEWETSAEKIVQKEAINMETKYSVIEPPKPSPGGFSVFINSIIDWFRNLWGLIFR